MGARRLVRALWRLVEGAKAIEAGDLAITLPVTSRAEIGQNVAEKVRADHDVKPVGVAYEMSCQNVDVVLVSAHVRVVGAHGSKAFIPERHGMDDAVRFGGRGQMLLPFLREIEGEAQHPVYAAAGEHRFLNRDLVLGALENAPANL